MPEKICPHIPFHPGSHGMSPIIDDIIGCRPDNREDYKDSNKEIKSAELLVRYDTVDKIAGN